MLGAPIARFMSREQVQTEQKTFHESLCRPAGTNDNSPQGGAAYVGGHCVNRPKRRYDRFDFFSNLWEIYSSKLVKYTLRTVSC